MGSIRAIALLVVLAVVTPPCMALQVIFQLAGSRRAATFPVAYHRFVCALLDIRVRVHGGMAAQRPLLLAANHASWLDIPVLSTVAPVSFIAKSEVSSWPLIGWLAKLQRSVFVDRQRRTATGEVTREIGTRLAGGDVMVIFAEGTSGDGNGVLPFRSALLGAVQGGGDGTPALLHVQPVAVAYVRLNGLPMGRQHRPFVAWHGEMSLGPHAWRLLRSGPIDVEIALGEPIVLSSPADRKRVAVESRLAVAAMLHRMLAGHPPREDREDAVSDSLPVAPETR